MEGAREENVTTRMGAQIRMRAGARALQPCTAVKREPLPPPARAHRDERLASKQCDGYKCREEEAEPRTKLMPISLNLHLKQARARSMSP